MLSQPRRTPLLIVLSGPSGVGKDAILNRMRILELPLHFTVTATTRPIRANERDGAGLPVHLEATFGACWTRAASSNTGEGLRQLVRACRNRRSANARRRATTSSSRSTCRARQTVKRLAPQAVIILRRPRPRFTKRTPAQVGARTPFRREPAASGLEESRSENGAHRRVSTTW